MLLRQRHVGVEPVFRHKVEGPAEELVEVDEEHAGLEVDAEGHDAEDLHPEAVFGRADRVGVDGFDWSRGDAIVVSSCTAVGERVGDVLALALAFRVERRHVA